MRTWQGAGGWHCRVAERLGCTCGLQLLPLAAGWAVGRRGLSGRSGWRSRRLLWSIHCTAGARLPGPQRPRYQACRHTCHHTCRTHKGPRLVWGVRGDCRMPCIWPVCTDQGRQATWACWPCGAWGRRVRATGLDRPSQTPTAASRRSQHGHHTLPGLWRARAPPTQALHCQTRSHEPRGGFLAPQGAPQR